MTLKIGCTTQPYRKTKKEIGKNEANLNAVVNNVRRNDISHRNSRMRGDRERGRERMARKHQNTV